MLDPSSSLAESRRSIHVQVPTAPSSFVFEGVPPPMQCHGMDPESLVPLSNCLSVLLSEPIADTAPLGEVVLRQPPTFVKQQQAVSAPSSSNAPASSEPDQEQHDCFEVYIGNLAPSVTADVLLELVRQCGPAELHMPRDANAAHRGFAFGQYTTLAASVYAIGVLDGLVLAGRPLRVRGAHSNGRA